MGDDVGSMLLRVGEVWEALDAGGVSPDASFGQS